ncbi:NAD(P)-dependent oxidoreductase [Klebsiella quasipneumoniae]|uniref:NAD(P)-dependent oxidoreductase n=1 Tax=Klebsiella quasipneumoniae TaxID=1463165 RepID=UPI001F4EAD3C|nr:NAD(P)-dependent oxidoreductase [Klebsiella quasipneumoniae]MCH9287021.1 NAD(P)-dependent oxidoreductase [Klebsiella quasipneumoniae]
MNVVFVGVGAIGLPMAKQIQLAGHSVTGVDLAESSIARAAEQNIHVVKNLKSVPDAEIVAVMVATPKQLEQLVAEAGDYLAGQTWVIMSTVGPDAARLAARELNHAGARVIDAPVTGGTARASTGELVIFASGVEHDIEAVGPVLQAMGSVRFVGKNIGDGQAIKVINQHLCSIHIVAAAEALNLARQLGLDPKDVLPLIEKGAAGSWMLSDRGPRMLKGTDVEVTSTINIFVKDSGLVSVAAQRCHAQVPMLEVAHQRYLAALNAGLGLKDDSRVIETWNIQ